MSLNLNWNLTYQDERAEYADHYLATCTDRLSSDELETIAKYILWGKDRETGLNGNQAGLNLEAVHDTWAHENFDSLDELMDDAAFNELMLLDKSLTNLHKKREVFSRSEARKNATPAALEALEDLWATIDYTDLLIELCELNSGKRTLPIRPSLLANFTPKEYAAISAESLTVSPYRLMKLKHYLVDLRKTQYIIRDSYSPSPFIVPTFVVEETDSPRFGSEIEVRPLGIPHSKPWSKKVFREGGLYIGLLSPEDFEEMEADLSQHRTERFFDFTNEGHIYELCGRYYELQQAIEFNPLDTSLEDFLRVFLYYIEYARLEPIYQDILELKMKKKANTAIADFINEKYSKDYSDDYISTLYCKKCIKAIADAAKDHYNSVMNLEDESQFKKCIDCGRTLLMDEAHFVRRGRVKNGFSPRCKKCEKILRNGGIINGTHK